MFLRSFFIIILLDPASLECISLFVAAKDLLIPNVTNQFELACKLILPNDNESDGATLSNGQRALGAALVFELCGPNLVNVLQVISLKSFCILNPILLNVIFQVIIPDILVDGLLLYLSKDLEMRVQKLLTDDLETLDDQEIIKHEKVLSVFNRVLTHYFGILREEIMKTSDTTLLATKLSKLVDLTAKVVNDAKRHVDAVGLVSKKQYSDHEKHIVLELQGLLVDSFVGSITPTTLFCFHSLLRELEEKNQIPVDVALIISRTFVNLVDPFDLCLSTFVARGGGSLTSREMTYPSKIICKVTKRKSVKLTFFVNSCFRLRA